LIHSRERSLNLAFGAGKEEKQLHAERGRCLASFVVKRLQRLRIIRQHRDRGSAAEPQAGADGARSKIWTRIEKPPAYGRGRAGGSGSPDLR
jgi:hypothetical protein